MGTVTFSGTQTNSNLHPRVFYVGKNRQGGGRTIFMIAGFREVVFFEEDGHVEYITEDDLDDLIDQINQVVHNIRPMAPGESFTYTV